MALEVTPVARGAQNRPLGTQPGPSVDQSGPPRVSLAFSICNSTLCARGTQEKGRMELGA